MKNLPANSGRSKRSRQEPPLTLSPSELRSLYLLKERHVDELLAVAVDLDEAQRRLAVRLLQAMVAHRRSMLS